MVRPGLRVTSAHAYEAGGLCCRGYAPLVRHEAGCDAEAISTTRKPLRLPAGWIGGSWTGSWRFERSVDALVCIRLWGADGGVANWRFMFSLVGM